MILNSRTIQVIRDAVEYCKDNTDEHNTGEYDELNKVFNLCNNVPIRFAIVIKRIESIPETSDIIVNLMVKEILYLYEVEDTPIDEENALWQYLKEIYDFDPEDHHLLKHTTEEALTFALNHIGIVS